MTVEESVAALDQAIFDDQAAAAAADLNEIFYTFIELTPGDGTVYRIAIVVDTNFRYWMATEFGPMYQFNPRVGGTHWDYVADKWLPNMRSSQEWTARVLTRFLNTLRPLLKEE